jgi:hypothetical protein
VLYCAVLYCTVLYVINMYVCFVRMGMGRWMMKFQSSPVKIELSCTDDGYTIG